MNIIEEIDSIHQTVIQHMNPGLVSGVVERLHSIRGKVEAHLEEAASLASLRKDYANLELEHAALQKEHAALKAGTAKPQLDPAAARILKDLMRGRMSVTPGVSDYHVDGLVRDGFATATPPVILAGGQQRPRQVDITPAGRAFVVEVLGGM